MSIGLLIPRSAIGLTVGAHGAQKLLGWSGGQGLRGTAQAPHMRAVLAHGAKPRSE